MKRAFLFGHEANPMAINPGFYLQFSECFRLLLSFRVRAVCILSRLKRRLSSRCLENLEGWTPQAFMSSMGMHVRPHLVYAFSIFKQCAHGHSHYEKDIVA